MGSEKDTVLSSRGWQSGGKQAQASYINNDYTLVAQLIKNSPAMWEIWLRSLGWEDPLAKEMATHSSILAWRSPWTV